MRSTLDWARAETPSERTICLNELESGIDKNAEDPAHSNSSQAADPGVARGTGVRELFCGPPSSFDP